MEESEYDKFIREKRANLKQANDAIALAAKKDKSTLNRRASQKRSKVVLQQSLLEYKEIEEREAEMKALDGERVHVVEQAKRVKEEQRKHRNEERRRADILNSEEGKAFAKAALAAALAAATENKKQEYMTRLNKLEKSIPDELQVRCTAHITHPCIVLC